MTTFNYFAYGSNLLNERIQARTRCPNAKFTGLAIANNYDLDFSKPSKDGSGKATIFPHYGNEVIGALFEIPNLELPQLDSAEGRGPKHYERVDAFQVRLLENQREIQCITYQAVTRVFDKNTIPYDWYLQLVIAGLKQHKFPNEYLAKITCVECRGDIDLNSKYRLEAIKVLRDAGYPFIPI